jgi:hypothetical protein
VERLEEAEGAKRTSTRGWAGGRDLERERATAASRMEGRSVALRREEKKPTASGRPGE